VYDNRNGKQHGVAPEKFFTLGEAWIAVLEGEPLPERSYRHLAFKTTSEQLPALEQSLRRLGVEIKPARPRVEGEGESLYFYDFDNHLFELHTGTLEQRLACYRKNAAT
jgi:fosfomycin resistance protein FosX